MAGKKRRKRAPVRTERVADTEASTADPAPAAGSGEPNASVASDGPHTARTDGLIAAAVALGSGALFASTFSSQVALGDAPEYVSGTKVLGVLHAPGYPAFVLFSRAFASVVPFGELAFRVNLFSLVCAALTVAAVFLIAREFGASRAGSAIAAFALASAASVWFYAGFAKHYAFSGLLLAVALLLVLQWQRRGRIWMLISAAVAIGLCIGAAQELAVIMAVGLAVLVGTGKRHVPVRWAAACVLVIVAVAVAGWAFVLWRAHQDPAVNWGDATSVGRLLALLTHSDFADTGASGAGLAARIGTYVGSTVRDLGLGAILLAAVGGVVAARRTTRDRRLFLALVVVLNLASVVAVSSIGSLYGFVTVLAVGGQMLDLYLVLAVLVALGAGATIDAVSGWARGSAVGPSGGRTPVDAARGWVRPVVAVVLAGVVIVPSLVVHYEYANHRIPDFADRYARRVLRAVPRGGVLVSSEADWAFPLSYRQIVEHERPDVAVIDADSIGLDWYQQRLTRRLGVPASTFRRGSVYDQAVRTLRVLRRTRPVVLDTGAMALLGSAVGYRSDGLTGSMLDGAAGPRGGAGLAARAASLRAADRADRIADRTYLHFPNLPVHYFYARAHIELAKQLMIAHDPAAAERELVRALAIYPDDPATRYVLQNLRDGASGAEDLVRQL